MDIVLDLVDRYAGFDLAYSAFAPNATSNTFLLKAAQFNGVETGAGSLLTRDNILRQGFSLFMITWIFGLITYFLFASLSYIFIFDHRTFEHPKYIKGQIRMEINTTLNSLPFMAICTMPFFLAEVRGYTKLYGDISEYGWPYFILQFPLFLLFTDSLIYLIHRALHSKLLYKRLHKPHHKWIMPTPYASHAFHPLDGFSQSLPYHIFPFIFPLQKHAYIALFSFINIWTVMIHDGEYLANDPIVNGAACHSLHHLKFSCNYGQFTTLFDRLGGSYVPPNPELFDKALNRATWEKQATEVDALREIVEPEALAEERLAKSESSSTEADKAKLTAKLRKRPATENVQAELIERPSVFQQ
ncbi:c-5 sterol desaturase [Savitreella phatthalungensis]